MPHKYYRVAPKRSTQITLPEKAVSINDSVPEANASMATASSSDIYGGIVEHINSLHFEN